MDEVGLNIEIRMFPHQTEAVTEMEKERESRKVNGITELTLPRPMENAMHERINSNLLDHCSRSRYT